MADEIDTDAFREKLLARARELEELSRISAEARGAVELDQASVGRVSRIDAIQQQAMALANEQAEKLIGEHMLLAWYDRDRDFESPQHASECHVNSAIPGYIDYALYHGATLKIDIEQGRFIFFYLPIDF